MQFWGILVVVTAAGLGQEGSAFVSGVLMTVYMLKPVWIHLCGGFHAQACICVQRSEVDVGIFPNSSPLCTGSLSLTEPRSGLDILAGQFTLGIPVSDPLTGIRVRPTVPVLEWQALGPLSHLPRL